MSFPLSHHKANDKNQPLSIFQNLSIFKLILSSEGIRAGSWGGIDVSQTHDFQMLVLDGLDLMIPKERVVDSDFNEELQHV